MTTLKDIKNMIVEEKIKQSYKNYKGVSVIHVMNEDINDELPTRVEPDAATRFGKTKEDDNDSTAVISKQADKTTVDTNVDGYQPDTVPDRPSNVKTQASVDMESSNKIALKANTVWTNNLTQLMNFQKGQQLAQIMAAKLQDQTGLPANQMLPIVTAVMKATLEQLDDEATAEMESVFPEVFRASRS